MALVFGYGSLVRDLPGERAVLRGHRRVWGVATDNVRHIPGYKLYLDRSDGSRPPVYVAFVDLAADPGGEVTGVVFDGRLDELDLRERNYDRIEVTGSIDPPMRAPVWAYRGSPAGRARLETGRARGFAVVSRDYLEGLRRGLAGIGETPPPTDLPVRDLERVDL